MNVLKAEGLTYCDLGNKSKERNDWKVFVYGLCCGEDKLWTLTALLISHHRSTTTVLKIIHLQKGRQKTVLKEADSCLWNISFYEQALLERLRQHLTGSVNLRNKNTSLSCKIHSHYYRVWSSFLLI